MSVGDETPFWFDLVPDPNGDDGETGDGSGPPTTASAAARAAMPRCVDGRTADGIFYRVHGDPRDARRARALLLQGVAASSDANLCVLKFKSK